MSDLVEFLKARLDEDEADALAASPSGWTANAEHDEVVAEDGITVADGFALSGAQLRATVDHIVRHDPARVLREVEAKRRIMSRHKPGDSNAHYGYPRWCQGCGLEHVGRYTEPVTGDIDCCPELRDLATAYSGHPDYREEWRP